jgi:hypothetical protein
MKRTVGPMAVRRRGCNVVDLDPMFRGVCQRAIDRAVILVRGKITGAHSVTPEQALTLVDQARRV